MQRINKNYFCIFKKFNKIFVYLKLIYLNKLIYIFLYKIYILFFLFFYYKKITLFFYNKKNKLNNIIYTNLNLNNNKKLIELKNKIKKQNILLNNKYNKKLINIFLNKYPKLKNKNNKKFIKFIFNKDKKLKKIIWNISYNEKNIYSFKKNKFTKIKIKKINKWYFVILYSKLINNFFYSALKLGINKNDIMKIINIMNKDINFKELNINDKFIIFSIFKLYNNINYNNNKLIGIKFFSKNKEFYILKSLNGKFYSFNNFNFKFMKLPTNKKFRISSNFSLNRFNPITSKKSPHNGIDIAMPIGTSILSVSNGIVEISSNNKKAGNYIVIRHNNRCVTKYMNLKKSLVKPGQKVNLGEKIAISGNSGRSTGPHLHFEIWIDYIAVNPLNIKLNNIIKDTNYINSVKKLMLNFKINEF